MDNFTLKQLRYFDAVVRHGHFGKAAADCAVSQPALSMQIRDLEAATGQTLLERGARSVRLTAFGERFASRAREILRSADDLADMARAASGMLAGGLRLGIIPTIAPYLLPAVISSLKARHPGLAMHLRETVTSRLIAELKEGRLDAAILALPVSEPSLAEQALFSENFLLVRPASEQNLPPPGAAGLSEMRLLLLEEGHCFRDQALSFCSVERSQPREVMDGSSLTTLVQMVAAGLGVTLLPEMAVALETRSSDVAVTPLAGAQPNRTIGMVWRQTSPLGEQMQAIAATVRQCAREAGIGQGAG